MLEILVITLCLSCKCLTGTFSNFLANEFTMNFMMCKDYLRHLDYLFKILGLILGKILGLILGPMLSSGMYISMKI